MKKLLKDHSEEDEKEREGKLEELCKEFSK